MKLERLHESVLPFVVIGGTLLFAIVAGGIAGGGRTGTAGLIIAVIITVAFFLSIREKAWILIPATAMLSGKVSVLPLPFSVAQLGVFFAFGTFLVLKALKIVRLKPKRDFTDIWMLIVLLYLLTVFMRNPVGVEALGSDRVGGRPYFDVAVAYCGYWVLSRSKTSPKLAIYLPLILLLGHVLNFGLNMIADHFPSTVGPLSKLYSGIAAAEFQDIMAPTQDQNERFGYMGGIGIFGFLAACSYWRPVTVINPFYKWRFSIFVSSVYFVLMSGFRSNIVSLVSSFTLGTYFRRGIMQVVQSCVIGVIVLGTVILCQGRVFNLPLPAQRALSFLPGNWDYMAKSDAEASTEWRVEMWKAMLIGNKYIENKWLGDGFGFTHHQLEIMNANMFTGGTAEQQENLLISGGVHSGPITAIRYVGYVGLTLFLVFLCLLARRSVRLIRRAEGTPLQPMTLYLCMSTVLFPFVYVFIFGAFEGDLANMIFVAGVQKMVGNSLDSYEASLPKDKPLETPRIQPPPPKFRRPPQFAPTG